jgi:hypothetical protein
MTRDKALLPFGYGVCRRCTRNVELIPVESREFSRLLDAFVFTFKKCAFSLQSARI